MKDSIKYLLYTNAEEAWWQKWSMVQFKILCMKSMLIGTNTVAC